MKRFLVSLTATFATISALPAFADSPFVGKTGALTFEVDSAKSQFSFNADTAAEKVGGIAKGITGSFVIANAAAPEGTTGTITVPVAKMESGNAMRDEHMRKPEWLNAAAHPNITFAIANVSDLKVTGNKANGKAHGKFTLNGVTKDVVAPIDLVYSAEKNAVKVTTDLKVSLLEYGIKGSAGTVGDKVSATIAVKCTLFGTAK
jgi:polyisoprenoid-binding protein YceI